MIHLFCNGTGTVRCFDHFASLTFYVQRAAVNEDSCDRPRRAHSLGYPQVIIIKDGSTIRYVQNLRTTYLAP